MGQRKYSDRYLSKVRSTGRMILRWDSGSTERETFTSTENWRNDSEKGQWNY
jgi:hypothetical protein